MERLLLIEKRRLRAGRRACLFACLAACLAIPSQAQYVFYNADTARIETTNSFWVGTGLLGGDGGLSIGYAGAASPAGGAIFAANVGIGDSSPASLFTVGAGDKFQINSAGNLVRVNNIAYSWPAAQGGVSTFLQNDGAGNLTWALTPGDNLGNHLATQNLDMAQKSLLNVASMTMVGKGLQIGTDLTTSAKGIFISTAGAIMTIGTGNGSAAPSARGHGAVDLQTFRVDASSVASGHYAVISGGANNRASNIYSVVAGGYNNTAAAQYTTVSGGNNNAASGNYALVSGGSNNVASDNYALVSGGSNNIATAQNSAVSAGDRNKATNSSSVVSGGGSNTASGAMSVIAGGYGNTASNDDAVVSGGYINSAAGQYSTVPGGRQNTAKGNYSLAAGYLSSSTANGAFTWSDSQGQVTDNSVANRTVFKNMGGFVVTGSTNTTMSGTVNRGLLVTGDGLVGIANSSPAAALDVVANGATVNQAAQVWRASDGTVVSSISATGLLTVKDSAYLATAAGSVGIGNTAPAYKLDVSGNLRATGAIYSNVNGSSYFCGGDDACLHDVNLSNFMGVYGTQSALAEGGVALGNSGARIYGKSGNVGVGTLTPGAAFTVGADQFQVNATGNLVKVNNIAYSWPVAQGAVNSMLKNDGAGNLTWAGLSSDNLGNHTATQDLNMAGFDITGAGYFEGSVYRRDLRTIAPSDETSGTMRFGFTAWGNNGAPPYADFLHLRSYTDATGGKDNLLMVRKDAIGLRLWQQDWNSATPYAAYKDFAFTDASNASGTWPNADTVDLLHKTSFGASLDTSGNNVRLLNSDGTQLSSITPPYATNADTVDLLHKTSFGASLDTSGNNVRLLNSDGTQLTSITPPYATNADTVDSLHATDFLRKVAAIDGNTQPDSLIAGQYWSPIYSNNYLTPYGHLLTLKGGTGASVTQLAVGWPGSDGGDSSLWVRGRRDTGSNIWGNWSKIWSDRNDGSGSLLDADQLDGLHKTSFGASMDTSGNNVRLLNSDGTQLTSITPPYATNADTVDGLHAHAGTNNEANKLVRTDGNGYIQAGWINTPSGDAGTNAIDKIYGTYAADSYVRYYTLANLASQVRGLAAWNAAVANDYPVAQVLRWKNYGVNHVIFDASNGTAPDGSAHNNTNPEIAWAATYPTLMGYNGTNTYGVRVSNAGYADTAGGAPPTGAAGGVLSGNYPNPGFANNASYPVSAADGNGLKFWNGSDAYKVSMGNAGEYHYGPVTDYSIKTAIDSNGATRGFTWGTNGGTPVGALNVGNGNFEVAGTIRANGGTIYNGNATRRWVNDGAWNYFYTDYGSIRLGPANATWAHIYADLPFYFNQQLYVNGTQVVTNSGSWNITAANVSALAGTWTGINRFQSNLGPTLGALSNPPLQAYATGANSAFMSFHRDGSYAVNMGLDSDNVFRIGGWSAPANRLQLDMSGNLTTAGGMYPGGNVYIDDNYGLGVVGLYDSARYQGVFAMGDSYKLAADGTTPGTLYGIAWTHTNVGGQSKAGLGHQALFMENGVTQTAIGNGIWTRADISASGSVYSTNDYYNANTAYGRIGANFYADTINTGVAGDPLELNYQRSGDVRFVGGDQTMALNRVVYPGSVSGLTDYQKNYYLASHSTWGLYTNTSLNAAGGLYDVGSRVAISRAEGRNYVDYSRYVYNNGAYSGSGWIEPSDLGVRYAANSDTVDSLHSTAFLRAAAQSPAGNAELAQSANSSSYSEAAIELRELNYAGAQTGAIGEAPRISFHWGGRVASQISMPTDGSIQIRNNPGTGYEVLKAGNIYSNDNLVAYAGGSNASGTWPISISGNADTVDGKHFNWSGQAGQPPWLWGGSDGVNMYVYDPSNFVVNNLSTPSGTYKHVGIWGGGRTDAGAILVNTSYRADIADTLDGYDSSAFLRKSYYHRGCISNQSSGCAPAACASGDADLSYYCQSAIYVSGVYATYYCERTCCRGSD